MIGVIADDLTGANDVGSMFAKNGCITRVFLFEAMDKIVEYTDKTDVIIIDTNSRYDDKNLAYEKVKKAANKLLSLGCKFIYKKIDSTLRGNIGSEIEAVMNECNCKFIILVPAFPKNNRTTKNGYHYINEILLENTERNKDIIHPMKDSYLPKIISSQTQLKVGLITLDIVRDGVAKLKEAIETAKNKFQIVIIDTVLQDDLKIIAQVVSDMPVFAGSSALAEELPCHSELVSESICKIPKQVSNDTLGTLIVVGSATEVSRKQTLFAKKNDIEVFQINTNLLWSDPDKFNIEINTIIDATIDLIKSGKNVLITSALDKGIIEKTKELDADIKTICEKVSEVLAETVFKVSKKINITKLIIAGGDTAVTVCRKLGIICSLILKEIQPGVPVSLAMEKEMLLVLKSGGFGTEDFFTDAISKITREGHPELVSGS
ncbi:MAG: four-carbon acid sugar kinase family protein [Candidatus Firestonebacteria bacterium]